MEADTRDEVAADACATERVIVGDDGSERRTTPCACLPGSGTVAAWPACASCGLPQAPGKDFCSFCGRRWVSAS